MLVPCTRGHSGQPKEAASFGLTKQEGDEAAGVPGALGEIAAVFEVAVDGLGNVDGQG